MSDDEREGSGRDRSFELELEGRTLDGRYRVVRRIGEGGMGRVWLAVDENLGRKVVLKVPHVHLLAQPQFRTRFEREIRSLIGLEHPHVVKVLDIGKFDGVPFAVMQCLSGGDLADRMKAGPQGTERVLEWLPHVARALDFIHSKGFIHRDVKPGNIMFDEEGNAFLGDFGIARLLDETDAAGLTQTGTVPGSPGYMPPEVTRGSEAMTPAWDRYSFAVVLYRALSGRLPHEADSALGILTLKATTPPRALSELRPDLPEAACEAVMSGLAFAPADRPGSCLDLTRAFAEAVGAASLVGRATDSSGDWPDADAATRTVAATPTPTPRLAPTPDETVAAGSAEGDRRARPPRLERFLLLSISLVLVAVLAWQARDRWPRWVTDAVARGAVAAGDVTARWEGRPSAPESSDAQADDDPLDGGDEAPDLAPGATGSGGPETPAGTTDDGTPVDRADVAVAAADGAAEPGPTAAGPAADAPGDAPDPPPAGDESDADRPPRGEDDVARRVRGLVAEAAALEDAWQLTVGDRHAVGVYHEALALDDGAEDARDGLRRIEAHFAGQAEDALADGDFERARDRARRAEAVGGPDGIGDLAARIDAAEERSIEQAAQRARDEAAADRQRSAARTRDEGAGESGTAATTSGATPAGPTPQGRQPPWSARPTKRQDAPRGAHPAPTGTRRGSSRSSRRTTRSWKPER